MKKILTFILLFISLFAFSSCKKSKEGTFNDVFISETYAKNLINETIVYKDKPYNQKEEVALYLVAFNKMPKNYYNRDEFSQIANKFNQENLISCYGGIFKNRERLLPENDKYHEMDIDYQGGGRGAKRIVYNDSFSIVYYTSDHYSSFVRVFDKEYKYDNETMFQ